VQALKKAAQTTNTLPPDIHYDLKMLTQLFLKPKWRVSMAKRRRMEEERSNECKSIVNIIITVSATTVITISTTFSVDHAIATWFAALNNQQDHDDDDDLGGGIY
jgi:hypothetical protein